VGIPRERKKTLPRRDPYPDAFQTQVGLAGRRGDFYETTSRHTKPDEINVMTVIYKSIWLLAIATCMAANVATSRENDLRTFAGTELELVLAGDNGETTFNNLDSLTVGGKKELAETFRIISLRNGGYLAQGFYLLDAQGGVEKYVYADEPMGIVSPSTTADSYLVCRKEVSNFSGTPTGPLIKELYEIDGNLRWSYELPGYVHASDELETVGIFLAWRTPKEKPAIVVINKEGHVTGTNPPACNRPACVSRGGQIIALAEADTGSPAGYPKGTRIFDKSGNLLFTLDPNYICDLGMGGGRTLVLYASANYIIQTCHKLERMVNDPPRYDSEGNVIEGIRPVSGEHFIQVYNRDGILKWQKGFSDVLALTTFSVSDNDKYVMVYVPQPSPRCEIFEAGTGLREYEIPLGTDPDVRLSDAGVGDQGSQIFVVFDENGDRPGTYFRTSRAMVYDNGVKIAEFENEYDSAKTAGDNHIRYSKTGEFLAVTLNKGYRIFRIRGRSG
jgi:hypothetical protein